MTPLANFTTATDLNDATRNNCVYRFNTGTANNPGYNYGFCYAWTEGSNVHQLAVPRGGTSSIGMSERSRGSTGEWGEWVAIPTRAEITALNNRIAIYSGYRANVTTVSVDTRIASLASGKTYLTFIRHYQSATSVLNNVYIITLLENGTWAISVISEQAQSFRPTDISHSGGTLTFTLDQPFYGSISILSIML